jgi:nitric oxide reductase subunit B
MRKAALQEEMRRNTYDPASGIITVSDIRARAIRQVQQHFVSLYDGGDPASPAPPRLCLSGLWRAVGGGSPAAYRLLFLDGLGGDHGSSGADHHLYQQLAARTPGGQQPTTGTLLWSLASVILLLAAAGALIAYYAKQFDVWRGDILPEGGMATSDLLGQAVITPSMRATAKYFWVVCALFVGQVLLGIVTAHYAVEGKGSMACPSQNIFPTRSPAHGTRSSRCCGSPPHGWRRGYVAPMLAGTRPQVPAARRQFPVRQPARHRHRLLCRPMGGRPPLLHHLTANFWFGHQGYEYVDLGRFWQIYLLIGLFLWVALVVRALAGPAKEGGKSLIYLVLVSALAIGLLYGAG